VNGITTTEDGEEAVSDRPLPTAVNLVAVGLNALLLLIEATYLLPRAPVRQDELVMVLLLVGTPVVNLAMIFDYYRRGALTGVRNRVKGNPLPLPTPVRWTLIGLNALLLFSEAVVLLGRGINVGNPIEVALTSLFLGTPVASLAMFLDYNRRGL
jgi:hypothetical protein